MRKLYFTLAVLATATLFSCQQEQSFNEDNLGENDIVFSLQGSTSTRAMDEEAIVKKGVTLELEGEETGQVLFLEETIQDLNSFSPETKGTPAYTENVGKLYENLGVVVKNGSSVLLNTTSFYAMDDKMESGGWRYQGEFSSWPESASTALDFYLWMPVTNNGITGTPTYGKADGKQTIQFSYTTPTTAADTQDLILAARGISKNDAMTDRVKGVPVLFNHALTGVKFAIANYSETGKMTIKSISFKGLKDTGTCTITPASENSYRDKPSAEYSSSADGTVVWSSTSVSSATKTISSGTYGAPVKYEGSKFTNNGDYPESFAKDGNENNLNDGDATQTFWLIPQAMAAGITITIEYTNGTSETKTGSFDFGAALAAKNVVWKAGELRTYTINVESVNVTITDKFSQKTNTSGEVTEALKNNVVITNTGNTDAYIRAAIIGQWVDEEGRPIFGFTDYVGGTLAPVTIPSWYQDYKSNGKYFGEFSGLPGDGWVLNNTDGYYYYTSYVAPGASPTALFTSYTVNVDNIPQMRVGGKYVDTTLLIEVATQAISAKKRDGTYFSSYTDAWENAVSVASQSQTVPTN